MSMLTKPSKNVAMPPVRPNRWDLAAVLFALFLSLGLFLLPVLLFSADRGEICFVTWDGGERRLPLDMPDTMTIVSHGCTLTIAVTEEGVFVASCDCPDRVCMKTGTISRPGEMIVCVPADVVIRIPSSAKTEVADYVVG